MKHPVNIFIDWGGCIVRDYELFDTIAKRSNNVKSTWQSPESWESIRSVGNDNYFDKIQKSFFKFGNPYEGSIETISTFCGMKGIDSDSQIYIVYDNKPQLDLEPQEIIKEMAFAYNNLKGSVNGFYLGSDKVLLAKKNFVDIFVDDDPRIAIGLACAGIKSVLMLRKWNRNFDLNDIALFFTKEKLEKIKANLTIVEDWYECGIILGNHVDEILKKNN
jgi:hypothetical protein